MTIDFITFKNYLIDNNILLFDSQYRIAHYRYDKLNKKNILKKINNKQKLNCFIDSLVTKNKEKLEWIINSCV
jgi:hypothetical protein